MRAVVQRVRSARVQVDGRTSGAIGRGMVVLLGVGKGDGDAEISYLGDKILGLRIFPDENQAMNRSLEDVGGEILLVSQFTLYGDCRRGRRPSFDAAAPAASAKPLYERFAGYLASRGHPPAQGVFGASMVVALENDGPVTLLLDSDGGP